MKSVKREFPNPVLADGRDDYIESCKFYTIFEPSNISVTTDNIVIPIAYMLVSNGLQKLIEAEKAVVVVSVKSSASSYSRLFKFPKGTTSMEVSVPKFSVVKRIEISGAIVAATVISQFRCEGEFNEMYFGSTTFNLRKGDILAREDSRMIYLDDSELEKPIASIFNINKVQNQDDEIIPDYSGEKIEINIKEDLFKLYWDFKDFNNGTLRRYVTGIIVFPVLIEAIAKIQEVLREGGDGELEEKRWFRAIEKKAERFGIDLNNYQDSCVTLADKMLGEISFDALRSLKDTLESEMNSGETQMIGGVD